MKSFIPLISIIIFMFSYAFRNPTSQTTEKGCKECHAELFENKVVHPITEMGCEFCHSSNGEKHPGKNPGFEYKDKYPEMCTNCHDNKNNLSSVHSPVKEGDCSVCHTPHSSPYPSLIQDVFSENACLDCHYVDTEFAKSVHGPVKEGRCQDCHDPHQTDHAYQLKNESVKLCLECHSEEIEAEEGPICSISESLVKGNIIHSPIKDDDCMSCHYPHSGEFAYQLIGNYPIRQYAEAKVENFELCFNCHNEQLLTDEKTIVGTNFRQGDKNLHYLHINGNRGRNCNLCHNAHGAPNKHLLEDKILFGKWMMPMGLELTDTGGSCATGCHKRLEYSRTVEEE